MARRIDPSLLPELKEYGAVNVEKCFNCGNCTAICPLTDTEYPFPRDVIRMVQLGLKDRLEESLDPWLCYYCGDCSLTCPKEAEPGELMMAARRWLTARYDWTGLAHKFYTSKFWEIGSMILAAALIVVLALLFHGPIITDRVELNTFAPVSMIHTADWIMAGALIFLIGTNILNMWNLVIRRGSKVKIPLSVYISEAWHFFVHLFTQKRWGECSQEQNPSRNETNHRMPWINHLFLVSGYGLMLVLIMIFLPWFQTDEIYPLTHPQRWLGYYATVVLIYGASAALYGRFKRNRPLHKYSHPSDWLFPVLLLIVSLTGILQHTFRYMGMPLATYTTYVVHLAAAFPMLVLEVPFGKWAHLYYRPLAMYFHQVKAKAAALALEAEESLAAAA